jgi:hypothetical protein
VEFVEFVEFQQRDVRLNRLSVAEWPSPTPLPDPSTHNP